MARMLWLLLIIWAVIPLVLLVMLSLGHQWFAPDLLPSSWTLDSWHELLTRSSRLRESLITSIILASVTALAAMLLALLAARQISRLSSPLRQCGAALAFLPVVTPPVALATALQFAFLQSGAGGTVLGVGLAHLIPSAGYATVYLLGILTSYDWNLEDEARTLGANSRTVVRRVAIPMLRRPLTEAFALAWLVSWAQVPLTLLVGAGTVRTLPVEVLGFVQAGQDRYAATGALLLVVPALAMLFFLQRTGRQSEAAPI